MIPSKAFDRLVDWLIEEYDIQDEEQSLLAKAKLWQEFRSETKKKFSELLAMEDPDNEQGAGRHPKDRE